MALATLFSCNSIPGCSSKSKFNTPKTNSFLLFHARVYSVGLNFTVASREQYGVGRPRTTVKSNVSRDTGDIDQGGAALEQNALTDGSASFRGLESTVNQLSKWVAAATVVGVILWRRDGEALWFLGGAYLNWILSIVLKRVFNMERPVSGIKSDPGMPSSHAQVLSFVAIYTAKSVLEMVKVQKLPFILSFLLIPGIAAYLSWLRVSQQLHTKNQVLVGALFGSVFFVFWNFLWRFIVQKAFVSSVWVQILVLLGGTTSVISSIVSIIQNFADFTK